MNTHATRVATLFGLPLPGGQFDSGTRRMVIRNYPFDFTGSVVVIGHIADFVVFICRSVKAKALISRTVAVKAWICRLLNTRVEL